MIVNGDKTSYFFEQNEKRIHLPRIYINDIPEVRKNLELLNKHKILSNHKITEETTRVRSENAREFFLLLWQLGGFGIHAIKVTKGYEFVANECLDEILKLDNSELENLILEKLKKFTPFVAILDKMIDYKKTGKKCTQTNIKDDFSVTDSAGNLDNVHPLCRWANGFGLFDKNKKEITEKGVKFVKEANTELTYFFDYDVDLGNDPHLNAVTSILAKTSLENKDTISINEIFDFVKDVYMLQIKKEDIPLISNVLIDIGLPISLDSETIKINNKIFHFITAQSYTKFGLDKINNITKPKIDNLSSEKILLGDNIKILIVSERNEEDFDEEHYTNQKQVITYEQFIEIHYELPNSNVNTIVIPSIWQPIKNERIIGILLSFVRFGGNLIIENINVPGRIGANNNRYGWLPHDLSRISSVPRNEKTTKGYFTFNDSEQFTYSQKNNNSQEIEHGKYSYLDLSYNLGKIIFVTLKNYKENLEKIINQTEKVMIDTNSVQWKARIIPSIRLGKKVRTEYDLYPLLRNILTKEFGIEFDPKITGKSGQTDMMTVKPFYCCCEVTPSKSVVTGGEKVGEVERHRSTALVKDQKSIKKKELPPYGGGKIGACVIGPSFSREDGYDKFGAVESAEGQKISLLRYMDIYELVCLNEKFKLTDIELEKIFFYQEGKSPEAAERIYELIKQKKL
jgi:hypothetical protein